MNQKLNTYNNDWYSPGKSKLTLLTWYCFNAIFLNSYLIPFSAFKIFILKLFGAQIGKGVVIKPKVNIKYPWKLIIGNYSWIGEEVWIDNLDMVSIGKNCCLSQGSFLLCGNHNYKKSTFDLMVGPIKLKDGSWIGAKATVCPGITLEENSILTVGSIATKNLEPNGIYSGNPAIKIKNRIINE
ncbi:colanic acid biosynthesis acetyltransferase WcaF [Vicingus serpentipes]|uniref:Colanic acid biosynthesis acetyltransferase WcaF n=1 Tax=Vicingus serpentipes TaxID=1926625 RepID=A0A5C6RP56_9FLAO|nr:putative colanic acid biosynthesis acetyltransferase [Vicingus serpentipes]TXB63715.1 colanic acid biosynthesis acetyltransferase WcaF [Vicingus serpentipes]